MIKILIVEDDPMVADINMKFLSRLDFCQVVSTAFSIAEAKEKINDQVVDLVLLDVFLPDGKGIDYLKWLRKEEINVDVLLITADKSAESVSVAFRYGAVDYLVKPFKFERLREALESYREQKQLSKSTELSQQEIDALSNFQKSEQDERENLIAGLNTTEQRIIAFVRESSVTGVTAQDVAHELGVSRITARKYLEALEGAKLLKLELNYGGIGRPKNVYRLINE